jgi:DNA-binding CsgD family transcriptional regulator
MATVNGKKGRSLTVQNMIDHFMVLHEEGHSIAEIAKICGVGKNTIYSSLDEIAEKNGVTRESLLEKVIPYKTPSGPREPVERIDTEELINEYNSLIEHLDQTIRKLNTFISADADQLFS